MLPFRAGPEWPVPFEVRALATQSEVAEKMIVEIFERTPFAGAADPEA